ADVERATVRSHPTVVTTEVVEAVESHRGAKEVCLRNHRGGAVATVRLPHDRDASNIGVPEIRGAIHLRENGLGHLLNRIAAFRALRAERHITEQNSVAPRGEDLHGNRV